MAEQILIGERPGDQNKDDQPSGVEVKRDAANISDAEAWSRAGLSCISHGHGMSLVTVGLRGVLH